MDVALSLVPSSSSSVEIDYESLPNTQKVWVHMTAGAMAGAAEHCLMFPVDSVKTRLQSLCPCPETKCPTPMHGVASMMKREGWLRPLRGVNAVAAGALPAHALYFSVYEKSKHMLTGGTTGYGNALSYGLAGCFATVVHDAVMNPAEVVKQRMQMTFSPYTGSVECIRCVYKREGIAAFYRSYATQLVMNIPFQSIHFMCYEFCQHLFNPDHKYDPKSHLCSGAIAGGIAAAVTTPLDVVKTVLNTQQTPEIGGGNSQFGRIFLKASAYRGLSDAVCSIYASRGLQGFMRGMQARVFFQTPATAISWTVYELFKFALLPSSDATS